MALVSSKVAAGMKVLADHFNKLREDLLTNHDHSSGKGGTVNHGDLSDGIISGTGVNHEHINLHIQGTETDPAPDTPGGDQGVHGLHSSVFVAGGAKHQLVILAGHLQGTDLEEGKCYFSEDGTNNNVFTFDATPKVFCQIACNSLKAGWGRANIDVTSVTQTYFEYAIEHFVKITDLFFLVVGTKT